MTELRPIEPDKAPSARFQAVGLRPSDAVPFQWYVVDMAAPADPLDLSMFGEPDSGVLGVEVADCGSNERAKPNAERIVYALNTIGRLLGDPGEPYMIEDVERLADQLSQVSAASTARAMQGMSMGETGVATMFGAEARVVGAGAAMLGRMLAELLKFALVGDTIDDQARAWLERTYPQLHAGTFDTITAESYMANLLDAYRKGAIAGMTTAKARGK